MYSLVFIVLTRVAVGIRADGAVLVKVIRSVERWLISRLRDALYRYITAIDGFILFRLSSARA